MPEKQMKLCGEEFLPRSVTFSMLLNLGETAPAWLAWCAGNGLSSVA